MRSSFSHLLPDLTRDSISGSSLFLAALCSSLSSTSSSSSSYAHVLFSSASSSSAAPLFAHSSQAAVPLPPPLPLLTCPLPTYLWVLGLWVPSILALPLPFSPLLMHLLSALLLLLLSPLPLLLLSGLPILPLPPLLSGVHRVYRGWVQVIPCLLGPPLFHRIHPRLPNIALLLRLTGRPRPRMLMTRMTLPLCRGLMSCGS